MAEANPGQSNNLKTDRRDAWVCKKSDAASSPESTLYVYESTLYVYDYIIS